MLRKQRTFADVWTREKGFPSGFDYMRIILAVSVLVWHSYQFTFGTQAALLLWSGPAGLALQFILPMFFSLSGFLVTGSLERSPHLPTFLTLRAIRIYPALLVEVVMSALLLGPTVTNIHLGEYFRSREFFVYMLNMFGYIHYRLPGVFTSNPVSGIVNTSLWTVPFELECYILISVLVLIGYMKSRRRSLTCFVVCSIALAIWMSIHNESGTPPGGIHGRVLVLCFLAGSVIFRFRALIPYDGRAAALFFVASIVCLRMDYLVFLAPLAVAYFTTWLGLMRPRRTIIVSSGDYSYGTYLYAGPIQQTIVWILGPNNSYFLNVAIALPIAILFSLFSWHFVEKPFLKVKRYIRSRKTPSVNTKDSPKQAGVV